ncbi:hypothetical protein Ddye_013855 [Dipteronia dyeriana]|uniref:WRKY domain-containing protein n=1 Tax=Dipteronia dyeriana TaxID=168575 RepID=A0AAD9X753_9ROSI|nr:hypothetical protein Ddye_013855 [Dipteronia dyeriana]
MSDKLPADNWDLTAVVRGCSSATDDDDKNITGRNLPQKFRTATSTATATVTAAASTTDGAGGASENPLTFLSSLKFEEEADPFFFPNLVQQTDNDGFDELQDSFKQFLYNDNLHQHEQQQQHPPPPLPPPPLTMTTTSEVLARPISTTITSSSLNFVFGDHPDHLVHHHHQSQPQPQSVVARDQSCLRPYRHVQSRSRKRKTPLKRMVCHVTAENLSTDLWAWRKYGQKPIKGSPYPRNYYRCSSSKGCSARKQVERSNTDPNIFVVSYTGDHTHPIPTHRNSLAGSSRNKFPRVQNLVAEEAAPPVPVPSEEEKADDAGDNHEEDDEDVLLIPNLSVAMNEDPFSGLDEFHSSASSGGDGGG